MGKSYDWSIGYGLVVFNPVGLKKTGLTLGPTDTPAQWLSEHASITFDQYGCEMPNGGMNDAGLAVEVMVLGQTQYPPPDDRPAVNELQFIQYALDRYSLVDDLVQGAAAIRISSVYAHVHYLACDATGDCAAIEFLDGKMVVSTGDSMPAPTLTNSTYQDSVGYLEQFQGFGGDLTIPDTTGSLDRFVIASALSVEKAGGTIPDAAFTITDSVSQGDFSKWNIVYDLETRTAHFRTLASPAVKTVSLADFQPDCSSGRYILDIDHPTAGDAGAAFEPYTLEANQALIDKSLATLPQVPDVARAMLALYPDALECVPGTTAPDPEPRCEGSLEPVVEQQEDAWDTADSADSTAADIAAPGLPETVAGLPEAADQGAPDIQGTPHSATSDGCTAGARHAPRPPVLPLLLLVLLLWGLLWRASRA
jgi:choloylglycine hydrolase